MDPDAPLLLAEWEGGREVLCSAQGKGCREEKDIVPLLRRGRRRFIHNLDC